PRFLLAREPAMDLVATSRRINDGQVDIAIDTVRNHLGALSGVKVLVLGLTYRHGVKELAYSRALPLIDGLLAAGADTYAYDPLMTDAEVERTGAHAWSWGAPLAAQAVVTQTGDPRWNELDWSALPEVEIVYDGRN